MTKMIKKPLQWGAALCMICGVMAGFNLSAMAQDVTLKMHHFLPPQATVPRLILKGWAERVAKSAEGQLKIKQYPAMQLGGKPPELIDQALDGVVDIVWTATGYTPGRFPRSEVFELPFMIKHAGSASRAFWQMYDKHMKDTEFKDLKILGTWVHGPGIIHSKKPIHKIEDFAGVKVRGGSRVVNKLMAKLGATPVGMPVPAVPSALSKGVITATTVPWEVTPALRISELVKNHTEFHGNALYTLTFVLAMNKAKYEALPHALKKAIDEHSGENFSSFAGSIMQMGDGPARMKAGANGNNIIMLNAAESRVWQQAAEPIYQEWIEEMNGKGIDGAALIKEAQTLIKELK